MPNDVLAGPGSWLEQDRARLGSRGREHAAMQTELMASRSSVAGGAWTDATAHLRPSTASQALAAGGTMHGAKQIHQMRPQTTGYDIAKHGWYHPAGQAELSRLADQKQHGSWAWMMHKAKDHNGYGEDGLVDVRDTQPTAVSGETPHWFVGTRTFPGPKATKKNPVMRCPYMQIEGKEVKVRAKTYTLGEGMSAIEHLHDRTTPPTPPSYIRAARHDDYENKAIRENFFLRGGCNVRRFELPRTTHVTYDVFEPPPMRRMATAGGGASP